MALDRGHPVRDCRSCGTPVALSPNQIKRCRYVCRACESKRIRERYRAGYRAKPPTAEYRIWQHMRQRCGDPCVPEYKNYGGRGIRVCDAWQVSFVQFLADVKPRPSKRHTLERIDNDAGYEPGNVKWATRHEQTRNMRRNRVISAFGETLCLADWADRLGIHRRTLHNRIVRLAWPIERALTTKPILTGLRARAATSKGELSC